MIESRAFEGTTAGAVSTGITLLQTIAIVPVMLHFWGKETYGVWLALVCAQSLLQTLDLGHQNYLGNEFNRIIHESKQRLGQVLSSGLCIAACIGALQIGVCLLIVQTGLVDVLTGTTSEKAEQYNLGICLLIIVCLWVATGSLGGIIFRLYVPFGLYARFVWWGVAARFAQFLCLIATAVLGGSLLVACLSVSSAFVVASVLSIIDIVHILRSNGVVSFRPNWHLGIRNFLRSLVLSTNGMLEQTSNSGLTLLVASTLKAAAVPAFTTVRTLANAAIQGTNILLAPIIPDMVRFHLKRESGKLNQTIGVNWFISGMGINAALIAIILVIEPVYYYWTGGKLYFQRTLFLLLAWSVSARNFGAPLMSYLIALNHLKSQACITLARCAIVLVVSLLLLKPIGIIGVGVALALAELFASIALPLYFVVLEFQKMNASLVGHVVRLGLANVGIVGLVYTGASLLPAETLVIALSGLVLLVLTSRLHWMNLTPEVQRRLLRLAQDKLSFAGPVRLRKCTAINANSRE